ncbi:hypothetical protein Plhal304r1_c016g0060491 [Plasmopara halstedii]
MSVCFYFDTIAPADCRIRFGTPTVSLFRREVMVVHCGALFTREKDLILLCKSTAKIAV